MMLNRRLRAKKSMSTKRAQPIDYSDCSLAALEKYADALEDILGEMVERHGDLGPDMSGTATWELKKKRQRVLLAIAKKRAKEANPVEPVVRPRPRIPFT